MRVLHVNGKCNDMCDVSLVEDGTTVASRNGYVPSEIGIGGGDYISLEIDADTGQILDWQIVVADMLKRKRD